MAKDFEYLDDAPTGRAEQIPGQPAPQPLDFSYLPEGGFTPVPPQAPPPPEPTLSRRAGLAARTGIQGATSAAFGLPALALDAMASLMSAPSNLYNLAAQGMGSSSRLPVPYQPFQYTGAAARVGEMGATALGLPEPVTSGERKAVNVGSGVLSSLTGSGVARQLATRVPQASVVGEMARQGAANPILQATAAGTGTMAAAQAQEAGASPFRQFVSGLLGSAAPQTAIGTGRLVAGATRQMLRGGEQGRQSMLANQSLLESLGVTRPTLGAVSTRPGAQGAEGFITNTPGGGTVMTGAAETAAGQLGETVRQTAQQAAGGRRIDATAAGRAIQQGGEKFVQNFNQKQDELYGNFARALDPETGVPLRNFRQTLSQLLAVPEGMEQTGQLLQSPFLRSLQRAVEADRATGSQNMFGDTVLPLKSVTGTAERGMPSKGLRQMIGTKLSQPDLTGDVDRGQLKMLYSALMQDMRSAVEASGNTKALAALNRADQYTRAGMQRIDNIIEPLVRNNIPEQVFQSMLQGKGQGATLIRTTMKSLEPEQQKVVAATMLDRLGRARPGAQGAEGDVFSPRTFLTELNKIDKTARDAVFGPAGLSADVDKIAKASELLSSATSAMANPSGTARNTAAWSVLSAIAGVGVATQNIQGVVAGVAPVVVSAATAKYALTNPRFIKWLGRQTDLPPSALPGQLKALQGSFRNEPPDEQAAIAEIVQALGGTGQE